MGDVVHGCRDDQGGLNEGYHALHQNCFRKAGFLSVSGAREFAIVELRSNADSPADLWQRIVEAQWSAADVGWDNFVNMDDEAYVASHAWMRVWSVR